MYNYRQNVLGQIGVALGITTDSQKDLSVLDAINRTGDFNLSFVLGDAKEKLNWTVVLKQFYMSKFQYSGDTDKIDTLLIENYLWTWGRVAIVKFADKFLIGSFGIKKVDPNNEVSEISFYPLTENNKEKKQALRKENFIVGKDCVIIQGGTSYFLNNQMKYSPFLRINPLLDNLVKVRQLLLNNVVMNRSIYAVPYNTSKEVKDKIMGAILNGSPLIELGESFDIGSIRSTREPSLFDFKDKTPELLETYNHLWEEIQTSIGVRTNANANKKERQISTEINVNNSLSDICNETELAYRKKGYEHLKKVFNVDIIVDMKKEELPPQGDMNNEPRKQK